jgi:starch synthase
MIALGTGQPEYAALFNALAASFPAKAAVKIAYDDALAHKVIAGSDMLLIPSRYEPCGLTQMYALRYGTVPVVRATGGLDDTVQYYDPRTGHGTGFKFDEYDERALLQCVRGASKTYKDTKIWRTIQANGMAKDFSWKTSAAAYVTLYEAAKRSRIPKGISTSNKR